MKLGIMQPYFFPYIGYWQLINAVDKFVIYDDVNYIKGGWINRNKILVNGNESYINILLKGASPNKRINEIELLENPKSRRKLLKTIELNYKKAPYFLEVFPIIKKIIMNEEPSLSKYLSYAIETICNYLSIDTEITMSSDIEKDNSLRGQDKIIDICKSLSANKYINAIGGRKLYDREKFDSEGIELKFIETNSITYKQFDDFFIPNLSIIDMLMFNSKEKVKEILEQYKLL